MIDFDADGLQVRMGERMDQCGLLENINVSDMGDGLKWQLVSQVFLFKAECLLRRKCVSTEIPGWPVLILTRRVLRC